jgi:hypothetical protein
MSLIKKLFGGGEAAAPKEAEPELYKDCKIFPTPISESGGYRLSARIEKEVGGELKSQTLIRADIFNAADAAGEAAIGKAKLLIDQMGDKLFT